MGKRRYGNRFTSDVTVFLTTSMETAKIAGGNPEGIQHLAVLNLHSKRLRHCSNYFKAGLDRRWATSLPATSPLKFSLEVHTDVMYYEDCFSRMYAPNFAGIPSVHHALELLKVASQIQYEKLVEASLCYLSLVRWSAAEEKKIRRFPFSLYVSLSSLSELNDRLRLHGSAEESYCRLYKVGLDHIRSALDSALTFSSVEEVASNGCIQLQPSSMVFTEAFEEIVSGCCYDLANDVIAVVTEKAKSVFVEIASVIEDDAACDAKLNAFCWLFELLWDAGGAQEIVEFVARDSKLPLLLFESFHRRQDFFKSLPWTLNWTRTMLSIYREALAGRLLLKSSDRVALLSDWQWLFKDTFYYAFGESGKASASKLVKDAFATLSSFTMTLPHEIQTAMLQKWLRQGHGSADGNLPIEVVSVAHAKWIKDLQRSLIALESAASAENAAKPAPDQASS